MALGRVIFINGIPSSGKSSVARRLAQQAEGFRVLTGDDVVRSVPESKRLRLVDRLFATTLDMIDDWLNETDVVMDGAWTEAQVREAKKRFDDGLYVILRIDEQERRRREAKRKDRKLEFWDPSWHNIPGPDELYDLVVNSKKESPAQCAALIMDKARERWPDVLE